MTHWITLAVLALTAVSTIHAITRMTKEPHHFLAIFAAWSFWYVIIAVPVLAAVAAASAALLQLGPVFTWSWWAAIGGTGNIAFGQTDGLGWIGIAFSILLPILLLIAIPRMAHWEEQNYRRGIEKFSFGRRFLKATWFGLVHMLAGVPLGVALALTIGGLYFTAVYLRGYRIGAKHSLALAKEGRIKENAVVPFARDIGVYAATAAHATYNYIVLVVGIIVLAFF